MRVKSKQTKDHSKIKQFFQNKPPDKKPQKPSRKLKGLDADTMKVPDFSDDDDTDATLVSSAGSKHTHRSKSTPQREKHKEFVRSTSEETAPMTQSRRCSEPTLKVVMPQGRSNSIDSPEILKTRRMAQIFEASERHTPSPETAPIPLRIMDNPEMASRRQRMADIIEGKRRDTPSPDRWKRSDSIGGPEMALRKRRVSDLIQGYNKPRQSPEPVTQRRNSGGMASRMQRVSELMQTKNADFKKPKSCGKRKTAREIMKQRFEKSLQLLAAQPRPDFVPSADLENDYGLQQYRASAPQFDERVKKLERKLHHYVSSVWSCVVLCL